MISLATFVKAYEDTRDRVLELEKLAVPCNAFTKWVWWAQDTPFWLNGPGAMPKPDMGRSVLKCEFNFRMRLVIAHSSELVREDQLSGNIQDHAWQYIAATNFLAAQYPTLNLPGKTELYWMSPEGITLRTPIGVEVKSLSRSTFVTLEFELTAPVEFNGEGE